MSKVGLNNSTYISNSRKALFSTFSAWLKYLSRVLALIKIWKFIIEKLMESLVSDFLTILDHGAVGAKTLKMFGGF